VIEALAFRADQTVKDLADELGFSYMGIKSQCVALEKEGYLKSRRKRRKQGRPEVLYSLDERSRQLFPDEGFALAFSILQSTERIQGKQAALKLLFLHFQAKAEAYAAAMKGDSPRARAQELAELRSGEGCFVRFEAGPPARLLQGHDPLAALFEKYPEAITYETDALARVVGASLTRSHGKSGETIFEIAGGGTLSPASGVRVAAEPRSLGNGP
jgi:predicted ArsR family transcriptional regulator